MFGRALNATPSDLSGGSKSEKLCADCQKKKTVNLTLKCK